MYANNLVKLARHSYRLLDHTAEKIAQYNYSMAKAYYHYRLGRTDRKYSLPPLLVYQMGKVGSSTITASLKRIDIGRRIYHVHFLTPSLVDFYEKKRKHFLGTSKEGHLKHIWQYQYLNKLISRGLNGEKLKIITSVREPVGRNISSFFTHIDVLSAQDGTWHLQSFEYDFDVVIDKTNIDKLITLFFDKFDHDSPLSYYDQEFGGNFNFNLFDSDFPKKVGYKIYNYDQADILLFKLEQLNDCVDEAFQKFLNIGSLPLINTNVGQHKSYAEIYYLFKNQIVVPDSYLDELYNTQFTQYFYAPSEIESFRQKWKK